MWNPKNDRLSYSYYTFYYFSCSGIIGGNGDCQCGLEATHIYSLNRSEMCSEKIMIKSSQLPTSMWFCLTFDSVRKLDKLRGPLEIVKPNKSILQCIVVYVGGCSCCDLNPKNTLVSFDSIAEHISENEIRFTDWNSEKIKVTNRWVENKITIYVLNDSKDIIYKFACLMK